MGLAKANADFRATITNLFLLDQRTQEQNPPLALVQLYVVNEAIFLRAFRAFENLLEEAFIHYSFGNPTLGGTAVNSFLRPNDFNHAYELIRSSQPFLEWNSPSIVISRSETYLENGGPIKTVFAAKQSLLTDLRRIRNHIAHNSRMSLDEFKKILQSYLLTIPLVIPEPGCLLQERIKRKNQNLRMLRYILEELGDIGDLIVR